MKYADFEKFGQLSNLIALLDRIEDEAMFRAPELRDFFLDGLGSSEGNRVFPSRYWRIVAELSARDRHFLSPDLSKMDLVRSQLEAKDEWEKLTWWMGVIWCSVFAVEVVEDRIEDIVKSTRMVIRRNPDAAAAIGNLVKISSELALGVQHAEKLREALENFSDESSEARGS